MSVAQFDARCDTCGKRHGECSHTQPAPEPKWEVIEPKVRRYRTDLGPYISVRTTNSLAVNKAALELLLPPGRLKEKYQHLVLLWEPTTRSIGLRQPKSSNETPLKFSRYKNSSSQWVTSCKMLFDQLGIKKEECQRYDAALQGGMLVIRMGGES